MMLGSGSWQDSVRRERVAKTSGLEISSSQNASFSALPRNERVDFVQFQE